MTALSCMISTIVEGLLGGLVHSILIRRGRTDKVFNPITAGAVTFVAEMVQMLIILAIARPYEDAVRLVSNIAAPMMVTNTSARRCLCVYCSINARCLKNTLRLFLPLR